MAKDDAPLYWNGDSVNALPRERLLEIVYEQNSIIGQQKDKITQLTNTVTTASTILQRTLERG